MLLCLDPAVLHFQHACSCWIVEAYFWLMHTFQCLRCGCSLPHAVCLIIYLTGSPLLEDGPELELHWALRPQCSRIQDVSGCGTSTFPACWGFMFFPGFSAFLCSFFARESRDCFLQCLEIDASINIIPDVSKQNSSLLCASQRAFF